MKSNLPIPKSGDLYLLFHHLPYDFDEDLPLHLGPGICLDKTPQEWLDSAEKGLADFLLPGYSLPGMGLNNCCLRCYSSPIPDQKLMPENLLFLSLLCLRLHMPLEIRIGGQFRLGDDEDRILEPTLYELTTPWGIEGFMRYTSSEIAKSSEILERIIELDRLDLSRLTSGLIYFSHVTLGESKSFQLSHLGLFAVLEALFVPSQNKANSLSKRISHFLTNYEFPESIDKWIKNEYINGRHKLAHGIHDSTFGEKLRPKRYQAFSRLHEITRLSLLGFLSMDTNLLKEINISSGKNLQRVLDTLAPASGNFLKDQKCWAS